LASEAEEGFDVVVVNGKDIILCKYERQVRWEKWLRQKKMTFSTNIESPLVCPCRNPQLGYPTSAVWTESKLLPLLPNVPFARVFLLPSFVWAFYYLPTRSNEDWGEVLKICEELRNPEKMDGTIKTGGERVTWRKTWGK